MYTKSYENAIRQTHENANRFKRTDIVFLDMAGNYRVESEAKAPRSDTWVKRVPPDDTHGYAGKSA